MPLLIVIFEFESLSTRYLKKPQKLLYYIYKEKSCKQFQNVLFWIHLLLNTNYKKKQNFQNILLCTYTVELFGHPKIGP